MDKWRRGLCCRWCTPRAQLRPEETLALHASIGHLLFLQQVPVFHGLPFAQLRQLTAHLEVAHFHRGEVIFAEGDRGQHLYIIVSGCVQIMKALAQPQPQNPATLGATDFFGDMGIFEDMPHGATAVADEATEMLLLRADAFKHFIRHHPAMVFAIGRALSARVRRSTRTPI